MSLLLTAVLLLQAKSAEQLVKQLGSDKVEERLDAARELRKLDAEALPALEKGTRSDDAEVAGTARDILREIRDRIDGAAAEKIFRKIEETFDRARSWKVRFTQELVKEQRKPIVTSGEVWVKEGNKLFAQVRAEGPGDRKENRIFGAGGKMVTENDGEVSAPKQTWPDLGARMTTGFLRVGILSMNKILSYHANEETDFKKVLLVSDFRTGPDEGEARTLAFRVQAGTSEVLNVVLTYDPRTFRPLKRTTRVMKNDRQGMSALEKYEEITIDAEIPDEKFAFPEQKK